jgi:hypothetical protein
MQTHYRRHERVPHLSHGNLPLGSFCGSGALSEEALLLPVPIGA